MRPRRRFSESISVREMKMGRPCTDDISIISNTHTIGASSSVKKTKNATTWDPTVSSCLPTVLTITHVSSEDGTITFMPAWK